MNFSLSIFFHLKRKQAYLPTPNTNSYSDAMVTPLILIPGLMCGHSVWSPLWLSCF